MSFYAAVLGEIFIVFVFVFIIWLKVLVEAIGAKDNTLSGRKLLITSSGLVINAFAVAGIMVTRAYELRIGAWPYVPYVSAFFVMLGIAGFLWIISASLGNSTRLLKAFLVVSGLWVSYCAYSNF
jgi:hypothetical protein